MSTNDLSAIDRETLFQKVWEKPLAEVADDLGVTRNVLRSACIRMEVPIPPRGHWSKASSRKKIKRPTLPKASRPSLRGNLAAIAAKLSVEGNDEKSDKLPKVLERILLPEKRSRLSARALLIRETLDIREPGYDGLVCLETKTELPDIRVSRAMIPTVAKVWHVIENELENRNVEYRPSRSSYRRPRFCCGHHEIELEISELIETITHKPTEEDKRRPSWEWELSKTGPSGRFAFNIGGLYSRSANKIIQQKNDEELETIVARVIEQIWTEFVAHHEELLRSKIAHEAQSERWKIERAERAKSDHSKSLQNVGLRRANNLVLAAHWWKLTNTVSEFINAVEERWLSENGGLTEEQQNWIEWANTQTAEIAPTLLDYPQPENDGPFDPAFVDFGGPYPNVREIPWPPNLPKEQQAKPDTYGGYGAEPKPYPFWLKHQR